MSYELKNDLYLKSSREILYKKSQMPSYNYVTIPSIMRPVILIYLFAKKYYTLRVR